jgi:hypothetical protein
METLELVSGTRSSSTSFGPEHHNSDQQQPHRRLVRKAWPFSICLYTIGGVQQPTQSYNVCWCEGLGKGHSIPLQVEALHKPLKRSVTALPTVVPNKHTLPDAVRANHSCGRHEAALPVTDSHQHYISSIYSIK